MSRYAKQIVPAFVTACLCIAALGLSPSVRGEVIVSDNFNTGNYHASIAGRTPAVANLPGGTWSVSLNYSAGQGQFYAWTNTPGFVNGVNDATSLFIWTGNHADTGIGAATIPLASSGSYTKPTQMRIQADIQAQPLAGGTQGAMIGFYATPPTTNSTVGFTGFVLNNVGALTFIENGVVGSTVAFTGTFDPYAFNTLAYTINTTTGSISDVSLAGNTAYSFTTSAFTNSATQFAAIGIRSTGNNTFGYVDNFSVSSIPEPATLALLGLAGLMMLPRRSN